MASEKLTIWCNAKLADSAVAMLKAGVGGDRLILSDKVVNNLGAGIVDPLLAEAEVAFGQPDAGQTVQLQRLKWVHLSSAGYARYDTPEVRDAIKRRGAILSNSSSVFAEPCAQHATAMILAGARQLDGAIINQCGDRAWPAAELRERSSVLGGQTVVIVGFGAIGRRLAELLGPFRLNVIGVKRRPSGQEGVAVRRVEELDELLGSADHLVNILPAGGGTDRFFDGARLGRLKRGAMFYNIGRGATVDQAALREALETGRIGGAYLDVTTPEPLPPEDPLWRARNCFITPHTAGGSHDEFERAVEHFLANLARFRAGQAVSDRVF